MVQQRRLAHACRLTREILRGHGPNYPARSSPSTPVPMEDFSENESWENWFRRHGPKLLLCARQWTVSMADAEGVVQEAFIRFGRRHRGVSGEPLALLLTSVRRAGLDIARRRVRREAREKSAMAEDSGPNPL